MNMHTGMYILDDLNKVIGPVPVEVWGPWFESASTTRRRVVRREAYATHGEETIEVSTVFLGLCHRWSDDGPPLVFETMVFGGPDDGDMFRCCTWDEALAQHNEVAERVLSEYGEADGLTLEQRRVLDTIPTK